MKKKLAIISSYHELCGISTYTEALEKEFSKYFDVKVFSLDLDLLNSNNKKVRTLGDKHIKDIADRLSDYDYVNIQFEAGLYGMYPSEIYKRMKILINSSKNLIVTLHSVYVPVSFFDKNVLKRVSATGIIKNLKLIYRQSIYPRLYKKLISYLKKGSKRKNINIMVHNIKDKEVINLIYDFKNVEAFPLTYLTKEEKMYYEKNVKRTKFNKEWNLKDDDIVIGLFGFISQYKGYDTAIKALTLLPSRYKVLICGSQHPMSVKSYEKIDPYIKSLIELINKNNAILENRILWAGSLEHEQFVETLHCCDYVVLPYMEVNQSGSGIATLTIETKSKALLSNSKTFSKLKAFYPNCFKSFDIGNYRELAFKIENFNDDYSSNIEKYLEIYNIENNILTYNKLFEKKVR